ncbi:MAG TPA: MBL fold metallo-hydrolase [Streptomyces sp.]|uniref:MBL fold metallo-hydrolase n=1 Tax=Streptomyces sp. TaxID=1931 RepID=UPI002B83D72F|nr:MBL fold metallo-hydrolase [Streptomyces sp.]HWU11781.1 MBL fold metallo-hydrolase [Streptomyces sp.]
MDCVEVLPQLLMFRFPIGQAYLWHDGADLTLIDAGDRHAGGAIEEGMRRFGHDPAGIRRIVLTHGHRDHYGAAQELADRHGAEILAHRLDAPAVRGEEPVPDPVLHDWERPLYTNGLTVPEAPPTRVDRELTGGEELPFGGGALVVHAPGHTPGSLGIHLPRHKVLFTGDAAARVDRVILGVLNTDHAQAMASFRRLAALGPDVACFGHGDPLTTGAAAALRAASQ